MKRGGRVIENDYHGSSLGGEGTTVKFCRGRLWNKEGIKKEFETDGKI